MVWKPQFSQFSCAAECADSINKPHEDYPQRVPATLHMINQLVELDTQSVNTHLCKQIHSFVMDDMEDRGSWRSVQVTVGDHEPPHPMYLHELVEQVFPIGMDADMEIWYERFQHIHPFRDGNGRVGGIIFTIMKYAQTQNWWAPHNT